MKRFYILLNKVKEDLLVLTEKLMKSKNLMRRKTTNLEYFRNYRFRLVGVNLPTTNGYVI
jgi:hypothetical protein